MADTHETIAEIIAEMRRGTRLPGYWHSCDVNKILQYHADRLEAAHKRELSKNVSKNGSDFGQLGDAAKLREALEELVANIEMRSSTFGLNVIVDTKTYLDAKTALAAPATTENPSAVGDAAKLREALVKIEKMAHCDLCNVYPKYRDKFNDKIGGIEREARAALSAPPRNCDRPECATTKAAQEVWRREDGGKTAYYEWLLATHKKGNNDAD